MSRRLTVIVTSVLAAIVAISGSAYAYWSATGSGTGTSVTGTSDTVTIATNATTAGALQPGGTGDLVISATNPNSYSVQVTDLSVSGVGGCSTPAVTLVTPKTGYLPVTIPAHANAQRLVIAGALQMGSGASNDCQGATLTLDISPTVQR